VDGFDTRIIPRSFSCGTQTVVRNANSRVFLTSVSLFFTCWFFENICVLRARLSHDSRAERKSLHKKYTLLSEALKTHEEHIYKNTYIFSKTPWNKGHKQSRGTQIPPQKVHMYFLNPLKCTKNTYILKKTLTQRTQTVARNSNPSTESTNVFSEALLQCVAICCDVLQWHTSRRSVAPLKASAARTLTVCSPAVGSAEMWRIY